MFCNKIIISFAILLLFSCNQSPKVYTPREVVKYRYNQVAPTNTIEIQPINPVTGLYAKDEFRVALLLPMTGDKKDIGKQVFDAVTMAIQDLNADNIKLFVFDTGDDIIKAQIAAKHAMSIDIKIVIGPVFSSETKAVKEIIEPLGIPIISLSNNTALASSTTYMFGVSPDTLTKASCDYLVQKDAKNIGLLLSNTNSGFILGKYLNKIAPEMHANIMSTEYYKSNDQKSILDSISKISRNKTREYLLDSFGNEYLQKAGTKKDKKATPPQKKILKMNTIYIDAFGQDLYSIMAEIKRKGLLTDDMSVMSGQNIIEDATILKNPMADGILFVNTATPYIYDFGTIFEDLFGYRPLRIAAIAYDAFSTVATIAIKDKNNLKNLNNPDGFTGIYGDFRFMKDGSVQRKFYVQMVNKKTIELVEKIDKFM
jgi:ABC-type branched-subunit amino acid transport system substrate-binding protein